MSTSSAYEVDKRTYQRAILQMYAERTGQFVRSDAKWKHHVCSSI